MQRELRENDNDVPWPSRCVRVAGNKIILWPKFATGIAGGSVPPYWPTRLKGTACLAAHSYEQLN